ncbi:feruloyl esterase [Pseudoduganella flava]|uniref:Feruloyl esterase n=1 Tax=Pseudoduganella flava TaxID=871742 RepID=A0A562Q3C7_9BURK|nr:tannase/feruloyl esterase family alpha/beta hydrolase [Pseudoduganella flava]QGZ41300.1 tannase/feruloyl esterase family alpha/beta hydrolase [Pseudoduganella flava]TWI51241.1 feruloyl esterase [Pseudoduganella flava]
MALPSSFKHSTVVMTAALLAACGGGTDTDTTAAKTSAAAAAEARPRNCDALAGRTVPAAAIGLPTGGATVTSVTTVASDDRAAAYCQVLGSIAAAPSDAAGTPEIRFQLNLPLVWNGKAVQMGGAGYNGTVVDATAAIPFAPGATPLSQGYATYGSDSGHTGALSSAEFALNEASLTNFGYAHIKKTHDAAFALIRQYYLRAPVRSYFAGGSTGGREGMTAVQRYPRDYDGVIANAPALNFTGVRLHGVRIGQAAYGTPGGFVNRAKQLLIRSTVLAQCDADDGVADGLVGNVAACRVKSGAILAALRCPSGADEGDTCLSDPQIATVRAIADDLELPYALAHGVTRHQGYNILQGADFSNTMGSSATPVAPPTVPANGYMFSQGDGYLKYFIAKDAALNTLQFNLANPGTLQQRLVDMSATVGATNPDIDTFRARGGKLIVLHGLADEIISPNATIAYYQGQVAKYGQSKVEDFFRFYTVPGFGHSVGAFSPSWAALDALDQWVEKGTPPGTLVATDVTAATAGRTRPLCKYPAYPRYNGGDVNAAASFACVVN